MGFAGITAADISGITAEKQQIISGILLEHIRVAEPLGRY
jgi:hypothetical protein